MEGNPAALFVGRTYFDITFFTDHMPVDDEKAVAHDYSFGIGGNAVRASFICHGLGDVKVELLTTVANDWLGKMSIQMFGELGIDYLPRAVARSAVSLIQPKGGKRSILRCRDEDFQSGYPDINVKRLAALHFDGHQPDAALDLAQQGRKHNLLTSLDGGSVRENTDELLKFIDVAVVSERFCEQKDMDVNDMLAFLRKKGCKVGAVTRGEKGVDYYADGSKNKRIPAFAVQRVRNTNGAGDVFHGAYVNSYLRNPRLSWEHHFHFAAAASACWIQRLNDEVDSVNRANVESVLCGGCPVAVVA